MKNLGRNLRLFLRFSEFVFATVVLGLTCYFLNYWDRWRVGPRSSEIFITVLALLSILLSVSCMMATAIISPHGYNLHLPWAYDFLAAALWFVAFGLFVSYVNDIQVCGAAFQWSDIQNGGFCGKWKADLAFAFLSAMFWLASCGCGVYDWRLRKMKADAEKDAKLADCEAKKKQQQQQPPPPAQPAFPPLQLMQHSYQQQWNALKQQQWQGGWYTYPS